LPCRLSYTETPLVPRLNASQLVRRNFAMNPSRLRAAQPSRLIARVRLPL
jgi:hypothetical protein